VEVAESFDHQADAMHAAERWERLTTTDVSICVRHEGGSTVHAATGAMEPKAKSSFDEERAGVPQLKTHIDRVIRNTMEDAANKAAGEAVEAIERIAHRIAYDAPKGPK
jgi:hypothetical protein